jgi:steroid delta-isomerase-like uncharacterized protein
MSTEENKALVRRFYEGWNKRNLNQMMDLIAPDGVDHALPPGFPPGVEGVRKLLTMYQEAFPDIHIQIEDMIAEGDKVVTRMTATGTNTGEYMGMPASGKRINVPGIDILRVTNGKLVEHWHNEDNLGMMQQLGAIPMPAAHTTA